MTLLKETPMIERLAKIIAMAAGNSALKPGDFEGAYEAYFVHYPEEWRTYVPHDRRSPLRGAAMTESQVMRALMATGCWMMVCHLFEAWAILPRPWPALLALPFAIKVWLSFRVYSVNSAALNEGEG